MYRFHPRPRDFVAGLRDPLYVNATFAFPLDDPSNFRLKNELGGGSMPDVRFYTVTVARVRSGELGRVSGPAPPPAAARPVPARSPTLTFAAQLENTAERARSLPPSGEVGTRGDALELFARLFGTSHLE